jgi:serine/threonine-protein kinase RsbW/stage II sporulation protein AB (anti-sigma F factor)
MSMTVLALTLPALPASIREARAAVEQAVRPLAADGLYEDIRLCVSEAATNAVRHAYEQEPERHSFDVEVEVSGDELTITVRDLGRGIFGRPNRDEPGGYGLAMIERLASRLEITSAIGTGTELSMVFLLGTRAKARAARPVRRGRLRRAGEASGCDAA